MKFRMITSGESSIVVVHRKGKERGGEQMRPERSHERLDGYKVYLEPASLCGDIVSGAATEVSETGNLCLNYCSANTYFRPTKDASSVCLFLSLLPIGS